MALSDVAQLVAMFGAGRVLCVGDSEIALAAQLGQRGALVHSAATIADLPITATDYDYVVVEAAAMLEEASLEAAFAALQRLAARWVVVRFGVHRDLIRRATLASLRASWEEAAIAAGFRRAPQAVALDRFGTECQDTGVPMMLEFELVPQDAPANPNDMTCHSGAHADAQMVRYALAALLVREGDTVLEAGCGAGYGSAIIGAHSTAGRLLAIDSDAATVDGARANYGAQYGIEFTAGDLAAVEADSIDLLLAFDAPANEPHQSQFMEQALRVLRPDGRLLIRADPSLDVTNLIVEEYWMLESEPRAFYPLASGTLPDDAAHALLVASVDPLKKYSERPFTNPESWGRETLPGCWVVAIAEHYDNPWLYRAMVRMGDRIRDRAALTDLAGRALGLVAMNSADFGGALTVLGYALLDQPSSDLVDDVLGLIGAYLAQDIDNPHVRRWQISTAFVAGRLAMARGQRDLARAYLAAVAQADFMAFGPLLATKTIAASFHLGAMALADGDDTAAHAHFLDGVASCRRALHADDLNAIGDPAAPYSFGFTELGEVADMGAQCAMAAKLLPLHKRSPGMFWKRVDTRKFGLVSWALALEKENQRLRGQA